MQKMSILEKHGFNRISRWPGNNELAQDDAVENYYMQGYVPENKFIDKNSVITAFGSCFAGNVSRYLAAKGYSVNGHSWDHNQSDIIRIDEIMVHTPALLAQFEWAFEERELDSIFIGSKEEKAQTYHGMEVCKKIIRRSDLFIITLGLTEAWYDKQNQQYLWKFVPNKRLDPERFESRFISFAENLANIKRMVEVIKRNNEKTNIIFTLSPIPLLGTYHGKSVVTANTASKATLKAALHEMLLSNKESGVYYFPSYELVNSFLPHPWEQDNRHISDQSVESIMKIFEKYYL